MHWWSVADQSLRTLRWEWSRWYASSRHLCIRDVGMPRQPEASSVEGWLFCNASLLSSFPNPMALELSLGPLVVCSGDLKQSPPRASTSSDGILESIAEGHRSILILFFSASERKDFNSCNKTLTKSLSLWCLGRYIVDRVADARSTT